MALIFSGHYNFLNIQDNLISLVSLEKHGRVKYCNEKYFEKKKRMRIEKNENENVQLFMQNSYRRQILMTKTFFWS